MAIVPTRKHAFIIIHDHIIMYPCTHVIMYTGYSVCNDVVHVVPGPTTSPVPGSDALLVAL